MSTSHSHLETYKRCPRMEEQKYRKKIPEISSDEAVRGTNLHKVFASIGEHCLANLVSKDEEFARTFGGTDEEREIIEKFAAKHYFNPEVDNWFEWEIECTIGGHEFKAIIDHGELGTSLIITDYKSDFKIRSQSVVDEDRQLRRYAVAVSHELSFRCDVVCRMDFVRYGVVREVVYTADDLITLEAQLIADIEELENATEFPATPGVGCDWCSYTKGCPAIEAGNVYVIQTLEQAEEAAARLIALDADRAAQKKPLEEWCSINGEVLTNGKATGYRPEEKFEYPNLHELREVCLGHQHDPEKFLKADAGKLKKAGEKDPDFWAHLKKIYVDKSQSKFMSRKAV